MPLWKKKMALKKNIKLPTIRWRIILQQNVFQLFNELHKKLGKFTKTEALTKLKSGMSVLLKRTISKN